MKYIVIQVQNKGMTMEVPIIFPNFMVHAMVAEGAIEILKKHLVGTPVLRPIAAGDINSMDINAGCYGKSDTLKMSSREKEDNTLIMMNDYGAGHR